MKTNVTLLLIVFFFGFVNAQQKRRESKTSAIISKGQTKNITPENLAQEKQISQTQISNFSQSIPEQRKEKIITGTIYDKSENASVAGAKIYIRELKKWVVTDFDGSFSIKIPANQNITLTISYVDMKTREISVDAFDENKFELDKIYIQKEDSKVVTR